MSAIHFEFDGAEDIAFWVSEDDLFEKNIKVMFEDLVELRAFLEKYFPGMFDESAERLITIRHEGGNTIAGTPEQVLNHGHLKDGWKAV